MDSLRGKFGISDGAEDSAGWDDSEDDNDLAVGDAPPAPVGQDERRMQVRAYNYWAGLLGDRTYPSVEDIEPDSLPDFSENSVLLDFTSGIENPAIAFLGKKLAGECGSATPIETLADVPSRSLLSRITDHYMQIIANEAPIGFEAEFINQDGLTVLYRGILLPFSTDDETIDFVYGVINWKEVADQLTTDELLLEIDQALENGAEDLDDTGLMPTARTRQVVTPSITRWADGPGAQADQDGGNASAPLSPPAFARLDAHLAPETTLTFDTARDDSSDDSRQEEAGKGGSLLECLAEARALAEEARQSESRSRTTLYRAVGRAYDLGLAAQAEPDEFARLLEEQGIEVAPRAPTTPVVKLVFGADYDKSRIAEYAAVLSYAQREGIAAGELAEVLERTDGGIKALVACERAYRREGKSAAAPTLSSRTLGKLGKLDGRPLAAIPPEGAPYALCLIRRGEAGQVSFLGEMEEDTRLLARAAKQLVG
ncbi:MAG: hypothetical protein CL807_00360 [Citromicrobium sp.]|nr:hypothetical protein [Citromicrobium sp.]MAO94939.1 hypothetical protein [Citromicrobium sp.]MAS85196.1 hypothetical protein [Erythrobacteraceae bacterium]MBD75356.1 hypothetical protein [Citromicrobium sp.]MBT45817.1 hypothetical protein [Citromicrobium sp.]|tara:strand:+ start:2420 stop:3874 length:1455 start_codon:yes stop_codon:yes gene_type:complete